MKTILSIDELDRLEGYDYKETDRQIRILVKRIIRNFNELRCRNWKSAVVVLSEVEHLYEKLYLEAKAAYTEIAKYYYGGKIPRKYFVPVFLSSYNPVTLTVFNNEAERKKAVFFEHLVASNYADSEIDKAMRSWSRFVSQGAIDITDATVQQRYKDDSVEYAVWVTAKDEKVCEECWERDGTVYELSEFPSKPHPNCRCRKLPYKGVKK